MIRKISDPKLLAAEYDKYKDDPVYFIEHTLGGKLDDQQRQVVEAFPKYRRIAVKSGHSAGKDHISARLALWFHLTQYPSIVVVTGPTDRQVKNVCFGELKSAYRNAPYEIGGVMLETQLHSMTADGRPDSQHYIIGFTANSPEAFQGFHSPNLCVIVTEAPGVEPRMWPGIHSLMTAVGDAHLMCIGNATYDPDSEFYKMFTSAAGLYKHFTLNSEKSSYCSKEWIREMQQEHGADSAMYSARVLGVFPTDIADTLIPLGWIERAQSHWGTPSYDNDSVKTLGVDVARFGSDLTCFILGVGDSFRVIHTVQGQDLMQTCGKVIQVMRDENIPAGNVRIDDTGLGGGVTDRLREQGHRVCAINFGAESSDKEKYANARSEMYWLLHERFREGNIAIDPKDNKLTRDLSVLKYKATSSGQIKMMPKDEAKKKLGYSPDRADALALAAMPANIADAIGYKGKPNWGLLEYMRSRACKNANDGVNKGREVASERSMMDVPDAAQALQQNGVIDGRQRISEEARRIGI